MSTVENHTPGTLAWFDLMTPDLEGARAFYGGLFGWTFEVGPKETHYYTMCLAGGRNAAGMGQKPADAPWPSAWSVYFASADADADAARIKELGGSVMMGPFDVMEQGRMAVCTDPTGAAFGLWQSRRHTGARAVDEPGAMCWAEVNTRDWGRARDFYTALFGLEARQIPGMEYYTLHKGETTVGGILQMNEKWPAELPPHWMAYFAVANADDAIKQVAERGGKVLVPPFDTPHGRLSVVADPWGAAFTVIQRPQAG